jgi:hypothetical protein
MHAPDGPAHDGPAYDGPTPDGPASDGPASDVLSYLIFDKHISYRNIVIQLVYRNIAIQPDISTFNFLGCLGYFFLFGL